MKVGLLLNVNNHTVDPATLAGAVERAGFESLWVGDHPETRHRTRQPSRHLGRGRAGAGCRVGWGPDRYAEQLAGVAARFL